MADVTSSGELTIDEAREDLSLFMRTWLKTSDNLLLLPIQERLAHLIERVGLNRLTTRRTRQTRRAIHGD